MDHLIVAGKETHASPFSKMSIFSTLLLILISSSTSTSTSTSTSVINSPSTPIPAPWPPQFHSILYMTYNGSHQLIDLWYDWPNGRNFNIIRDQLSDEVLYDLEWNNGTSFFYTLDSNKKCRTAFPGVGILRQDWMDGAVYLGQERVGGFLCNVWEKVGFIWYYEDVVTKRPVYWRFYTGRSAQVMTFEVGAALEDAKWQAPVYCFGNKNGEPSGTVVELRERVGFSRVFHLPA